MDAWEKFDLWKEPESFLYMPLTDLTPAEQVVALAINLDDQIQNGGLCQYFDNAYGDDAGLAHDALLAIGADGRAEAYQRALTVFPESAPPVDTEARRDILSNLPEEQFDFLNELDGIYHSHADLVPRLVAEYIQRNRKDIRGSEEFCAQ